MLGDVIRKLRKDRGWTQSQLGEMIGVKKAAVQKYESGTVKNIKQETLNKLAEAFDTTAGMLVAMGNETALRKEVILIEEIKCLYGDESVELLSIFTELPVENQHKVIEYALLFKAVQGDAKDLER